MAHENIEIEIRIPVSLQKLAKVRKHLKSKAKFLGKSRDVDKYYDMPKRSFLKSRHPVEYLRTRQGRKGNYINYKYNYLDKSGKKTHADEYESEVQDPANVDMILLRLGFENFMTVDKTLESFRVGEFEVVIDKVVGLGSFVEIEAMEKKGDRKHIYEKLMEFAAKIGLDPEKQDNNGYVLLLMKKKGLV